MKEITVNSQKWGLKTVLVDDEDFEWLKKWRWSVRKSKNRYMFYAYRIERVKPSYRTILMHRRILNISDTKTLVDHKDRDGLNNQKSNLRLATNSQNGANTSARKNFSSKYLGVYWSRHCNKWRAQMTKNNIRKHLGLFLNEKDAALAYDKQAKILHGEFANLNFP